MARGQRADGAERRHLGHAPGMEDVEAVAFLEARESWPGARRSRRRRSRAARSGRACPGSCRAPAAGRATRSARPLSGSPAPGRADRARLSRRDTAPETPGWRQAAARKRQSPRVDVEHRHDRQHRVVLAERQRIAQSERERVQHDGPVRIEHALRPAGRARRVAHRGGVVLVELRLLETARGRRPRAAARSRAHAESPSRTPMRSRSRA